MGLILCITALILLGFLLLPAIAIGTLMSLFKHRGNRYYRDVAFSLDQFGNVLCQYLFNYILIKQSSISLFGNPDETISSVLGKNERDGTLIFMGVLIVVILDFFQKDHCKRSIDE